jgi:formylglycine-generating enzyme required for sulfatase activity
MGGNVYEWNDAVISGSFRGLRGGSWFDSEFDLRSSFRLDGHPDSEFFDVGFRVASP